MFYSSNELNQVLLTLVCTTTEYTLICSQVVICFPFKNTPVNVASKAAYLAV